MRWKLPNGESLTVAQTNRFQHLRLDTRELTVVDVAKERSGKRLAKDPVGYEALFAVDPGVRNMGIAFVIRDHLDPKNLRLEFAQQVEFDDSATVEKVCYCLVRSMDAWLKNWNRYKLRDDVRNRLQRVVVVVEQTYSPPGEGNGILKGFVDSLRSTILSTTSQCEHEFKVLVVSPQSVRKYCGLPSTKKYRVRKAQTKTFVERGLGVVLERHDIADAIALAVTALKGGSSGKIRLVPVEIRNTDFLFEPPDEQPPPPPAEDELTEAGAKGFLYVDDEDPGIKNGDDTLDIEAGLCDEHGPAGLCASSSQPEEAGAALRPDAGPAGDGDDCKCDHCADDAEMPCVRDPIWAKNDDYDERPYFPFPEDRRLFERVDSEY